MAILAGETHTGLLLHSHALKRQDVEVLLSRSRAEKARLSTRPTSHAISPQFLTGLDCQLPTKRRVNVVGTATGRTVVIGGLLAQTTSYAHITQGQHRQRMPWSYYLARPGTLETIGAQEPSGFVSGFLDMTAPPAHTLDFGGISTRQLDSLLAAESLDKRPPIRLGTTRLRWSAEIHDSDSHNGVTFSIKDSPLRTLRVRCPQVPESAIAELCEDIAAHDWLLTSVLTVMERAGIGRPPRTEVIDRLQPIVDHVIPLWMPAARTHVSLIELWRCLEDTAGFTRQWDNLVQSIRDQFTAATVAAMRRPRHDWEMPNVK